MSESYIYARFQQQFSRDNQHVFDLDVDITLPAKGIIALFGHSGSGKTTLLRCMAGLQKSQDGEMIVKGEVWQNHTSLIATHKRQLAYVFQEASLLPHLTVQDNLNFAIKRAKPADQQSQSEIIELMGLGKLLKQLPSQLSGGEKQRVALARTLMTQTKLILMDEPLASLDLARKLEILPYLEKLKASTQVPIIYISHDISEVARLADYVVVLEQGKVAMHGPVVEVLPHISQLQGMADETSVVLEAKVVAREEQWHLIQVNLANSQQSTLCLRDSGEKIGDILRLRLLAKDLSIALENHDDSSIVNRLAATISAIQTDPDPAMVLVELQVGQCRLIARITQRSLSHLKLEVGKPVWAQIKSVAIVN